MNDTALLNELTEVAERLTLGTTKLQALVSTRVRAMEHGTRLRSRRRVECRRDAHSDSLRVRSSSPVTEDNLPYYFQTIDRMFGRKGVWREWSHR